MIELTASELLKMRTTRAPWVVAGLLAAAAVALATLNASFAGSQGTAPLQPDSLPSFIRAPGQIVGFGMLLLGVISTTAEFRHRTAVTTFLAEPRRGRVLAAKGLALATVAAVVAAVAAMLSLLAAAVFFQAREVAFRPTQYGAPAALVGLLLAVVLAAVLGVALGALLQNTAAALTTALGWTFVIEGLLPVVTRNPDLVRWLPGGAFSATQAMGTSSSDALLAPPVAVSLLALYVAAVGLAGFVLVRRREL